MQKKTGVPAFSCHAAAAQLSTSLAVAASGAAADSTGGGRDTWQERDMPAGLLPGGLHC